MSLTVNHVLTRRKDDVVEYYSVTHGVRLPEGIGPLDGSDRADLFSISALLRSGSQRPS